MTHLFTTRIDRSRGESVDTAILDAGRVARARWLAAELGPRRFDPEAKRAFCERYLARARRDHIHATWAREILEGMNHANHTR